MKKIILLPFCFMFIFCSNQIKMNKGKDVDIILPSKYISTQEKLRYLDASGYAGKSSWRGFGVGLWGYSKSWGNRDNVGELWQGQKSKTTWETISNGIGFGADIGGKVFWSDYTLLRKLF